MKEIGIFHQHGYTEAKPHLGPEVLPTVPQVRVIFATGSNRRVGALYDWVRVSGLPNAQVEVINGWEAEPGADAAQKAMSKVIHAVTVVLGNQNLDGLNLFVATDAVNYYDGEMREKPQTLDEIRSFHDEWSRAQRDGSVITVEGGLAVMAIFNGRFSGATSLDRIGLMPIGREYIERAFMVDPQQIMQNAHGLSSFPGLRNGDIKAINLSGAFYPDLGASLSPREAIERIDGVGPRRIGQLVARAIKPFGVIGARAE